MPLPRPAPLPSDLTPTAAGPDTPNPDPDPLDPFSLTPHIRAADWAFATCVSAFCCGVGFCFWCSKKVPWGGGSRVYSATIGREKCTCFPQHFHCAVQKVPAVFTGNFQVFNDFPLSIFFFFDGLCLKYQNFPQIVPKYQVFTCTFFRCHWMLSKKFFFLANIFSLFLFSLFLRLQFFPLKNRPDP